MAPDSSFRDNLLSLEEAPIKGDSPDALNTQLELIDTQRKEIIQYIKSDFTTLGEWAEHYADLPLIKELFPLVPPSGSANDANADYLLKKFNSKQILYRKVIIMLVQLASEHPIHHISSLYLSVPGVLAYTLMSDYMFDIQSDIFGKQIAPRVLNSLRSIYTESFTMAGFTVDRKGPNLREENMLKLEHEKAARIQRSVMNKVLSTMLDRKEINKEIMQIFKETYKQTLFEMMELYQTTGVVEIVNED